LNVSNATEIPCASLNIFDLKSSDGSSIYNYSQRGAAIRCSEAKESGIAAIRFTASADVPEIPSGASANESKSYSIVDFGFVYCLSDSIVKDEYTVADENASKLDITKLVADGMSTSPGANSYGINCAVMSYKGVTESGSTFKFSTYDANGKYTGSSTYGNADLENAKHITFNLVIKVSQENYKRFYAVRSYVTYKYLGMEFTVYDADDKSANICSSRSVYYVADKAYNSSTEIQTNKDYIYETILSLYK
jgi:hypothetical protein